MSFLKQMPHWLLADIILLILALFFKFAMRGYGYIAFALIYAAALVTLCRFLQSAEKVALVKLAQFRQTFLDNLCHFLFLFRHCLSPFRFACSVCPLD